MGLFTGQGGKVMELQLLLNVRRCVLCYLVFLLPHRQFNAMISEKRFLFFAGPHPNAHRHYINNELKMLERFGLAFQAW